MHTLGQCCLNGTFRNSQKLGGVNEICEIYSNSSDALVVGNATSDILFGKKMRNGSSVVSRGAPLSHPGDMAEQKATRHRALVVT